MSALPGRLVLLGHPVAHSLSPVFQNAALRRAGLPLTYEALDVPPARLERVASELRVADAAGNVTVPHKETFGRLCARR
jgi:shikimate dehydrogenase